MHIRMLEEVSMPRAECNHDRNKGCSTGLHFMSKKYSLRYGSETIVVLVNPMNVVAFPYGENSKGRCCRYMPVALAEMDGNDFKPFKDGVIAFEYANNTKERLEKALEDGTWELLVETGEVNSETSSEDFSFLREQIEAKLANKFNHED